jgi:hypothetical protein
VAAGVQQHDRLGRQAAEVIDHALEGHAARCRVVVRVVLEREARGAEQRRVVRPRRVAHVHHGVRCRGVDQLRPDAQRPAAAHGLDRRGSIAQLARQRAQRQLDDALVELEVARGTHVGLAGLPGQDRTLGLTDGGRDRRVAVGITVDADA